MTPTDLARAAGTCGMVSRQHDSGFAARGDYRFVAAAAVSSLLVDAVRTSSDYNDCMLASGAVPDDGKPHMPAQPGPAPAPAMVAREDLPAPAPLLYGAQVQPALARMPPAGYDPAPDRMMMASRAIDRPDSWMRAQSIIKRADPKARDLYLVLCGGGDQSSCIMAAALGQR
jgi:hypothetical protein